MSLSVALRHERAGFSAGIDSPTVVRMLTPNDDAYRQLELRCRLAEAKCAVYEAERERARKALEFRSLAVDSPEGQKAWQDVLHAEQTLRSARADLSDLERRATAREPLPAPDQV